MAINCSHLEAITAVPDGGTGCPGCVAQGSSWVSLRQCLACGQVGCCDSSPNTHATKQHKATGHPITRSVRPGQDWMWSIGQHIAGGGAVGDVDPELTTDQGVPLGSWVSTYRDRGRRGELRADERDALESVPGWPR